MLKRYFLFSLNLILFLLGVFLVLHSQPSITGLVIYVSSYPAISSLIGFYLIIFSLILFLLRQPALHEHRLKIASAIGSDPGLIRLAEEATRDPRVQEELNRLTRELARGNTHAGLGTQHVQRTDINYLRGHQGGRLYYRETPHGYQIVGKSSKDEHNQDAVMRRLRERYSH